MFLLPARHPFDRTSGYLRQHTDKKCNHTWYWLEARLRGTGRGKCTACPTLGLETAMSGTCTTKNAIQSAPFSGANYRTANMTFVRGLVPIVVIQVIMLPAANRSGCRRNNGSPNHEHKTGLASCIQEHSAIVSSALYWSLAGRARSLFGVFVLPPWYLCSGLVLHQPDCRDMRWVMRGTSVRTMHVAGMSTPTAPPAVIYPLLQRISSHLPCD